MLYAMNKKAVPQVASDLGLLVWIGLWLLLATGARRGVQRLAQPAYTAQDSAQAMLDDLGSATISVGDLPLIGEFLAPGLASYRLSVAGLVLALEELIQLIEVTALVVMVVVAVVPILVYLWKWLPWRWAFVAQASAGRRLMSAESSVELFALRAIAQASLDQLLQVTPDPMGAWQRGDAVVIRQLADLELARDGLRYPSTKLSRPDSTYLTDGVE